MQNLELKTHKIENLFFLQFLCASIIPLLVLGPFFPDLILSSLSIWFIYFTVKNKLYDKFNNIYFFIFIVFCFISIISSILSENIYVSLKSSSFYFRIGIFALLISFLIEQDRKILNYFYYSFLATFSILVVDGYLQYFTGFNIVGYKLQGVRVSSFFKDELILGSYLVRLLPLFLALFVIREKKNSLENYFFYLLFICIYLLIFLSGERTSFFFLNLFILFQIIFLKRGKLIRMVVLFVSITSVLTLSFNDSKYYDRFILSPIKSIGFEKSLENRNWFTPEHDSLYKTAWNMFLDKPIIGHGPKMFRIKCSDRKYAEGMKPCDTHPHNFYIQLLAEMGLVGFIFLFSSFVYLISLILKHVYKKIIYNKLLFSDYQLCLLSGLLITLWPLSPNGSFFNNTLMIFYSLQIGFFPINKSKLF